MTQRLLYIFLAVVDEGTMSSAAKKLYIAQPSISGAIAELERHYNTKLFDRLGRRLYLTEAGRRLSIHARRLLEMERQMELEMRENAQNTPLRLGATVTVGATILSGIIKRLNSPAAPFVRIDNSAEIETLLLKSELDAALVEGCVHSPDLLVKPVIQDELILLCPPGHPFAQKREISLHMLDQQPFILREAGSGTRSLFEETLRSHNIAIRQQWVCSSPAAILQAVENGLGLTVISRRLAQEKMDQGRVCGVAFENHCLQRDFSLVYHRDKYLTPQLLEFFVQCEEV